MPAYLSKQNEYAFKKYTLIVFNSSYICSNEQSSNSINVSCVSMFKTNKMGIDLNSAIPGASVSKTKGMCNVQSALIYIV